MREGPLRGRPSTRSVHREVAGCVIEPRKFSREADVIRMAEGNIESPQRSSVARLAGVRERSMSLRVARELGRPRWLRPEDWQERTALSTSRPSGEVPAPPGSEPRGTTDGTVEWRKRNETGWPRGVGDAHSTREAGEPCPGGPSGGKVRTGTRTRWGERRPTCQGRTVSQRNFNG